MILRLKCESGAQKKVEHTHTVALREIETTVLTQPSVFLSQIGLFCRSLIPFHGKRDVFPT